MRRIAAVSLSAALAVSCLFGCGPKAADAPGFDGHKVASTDVAGQWECDSLVVDGSERDADAFFGGDAVLALGDDGMGEMSVDGGESVKARWRQAEPYSHIQCDASESGESVSGDVYVDSEGHLVWHVDGQGDGSYMVWERSGKTVLTKSDDAKADGAADAGSSSVAGGAVAVAAGNVGGDASAGASGAEGDAATAAVASGGEFAYIDAVDGTLVGSWCAKRYDDHSSGWYALTIYDDGRVLSVSDGGDVFEYKLDCDGPVTSAKRGDIVGEGGGKLGSVWLSDEAGMLEWSRVGSDGVEYGHTYADHSFRK